jgi:hypothetical protein
MKKTTKAMMTVVRPANKRSSIAEAMAFHCLWFAETSEIYYEFGIWI